MSKLFFKVALANTVERFRKQQRVARALGWSLSVRNVSRQRGIPVFLFFLNKGETTFSSASIADIEAELAGAVAA